MIGRRMLLALLLSVSSCGIADDTLVVFAAASVTDAFEPLDPGARFTFAGSDLLAAQIREGARADIFASAGEAPAARLFDEGLIHAPVTFATNRVVLIVPTANRARITRIEDLRRPGVRIVVAAPGVPLGDTTRAALTALGARDVLRRVVSEELDARAVTGKVAIDEVDAAFVYATDAAAVRDRVRAIELPGSHPPARYRIAVLTRAPHQVAARAFVARVIGAEGRAALTAAGFGLP